MKNVDTIRRLRYEGRPYPLPMQKKSPSSSAFLSPRASIALPLCAAIFLIVTGTLLAFLRAEAPPAQTSQRTLTFEERVSYQRAIEEVYWRHRIWPRDRGERPDPKPSLDAVMSQAQIEKKVADYLRNSQALEDYWHRPITAEQLQAEMDRMASHTRQPEVLQELFEALGNDPFVIAECLARPALAERLLTNWYAYDQRIHGDLKQRAETELQTHSAVDQMKQLSGKYSEIELTKTDSGKSVGQAPRLPSEQSASAESALQHQHSIRSINRNSHEWDQAVQKLATTLSEPRSRLNGTDPAIAGNRPSDSRRLHRGEHAVVAAHQTMPVGKLSSLQEDDGRYYALAVVSKANDHLKLATISWFKKPFESWLAKAESQTPTSIPAPTGNYTLPEITGVGCIDDTWTLTAGPPDSRYSHTAVWTGTEMIIWGGWDGIFSFNTGAKYDPSTDSWTTTSLTNAPVARTLHTAIWTGNEMIVWGGWDQNGFLLDTGGKYNPNTDSWTATSTTNAPDARRNHTAVWTGSEMIVWGGFFYTNTGGRYNPNTNSWTATSITNAPEPRLDHTAVWTGTEMIIWGGTDHFTWFNTGGRYNPDTDSWASTSTLNTASGREAHTAVWTGSEMIAWGGYDGFNNLDTGGRYNPGTDSWTAVSTTNAPEARTSHTAVWTSSQMIVWGGHGNNFPFDLNTGRRYDPNTDNWIALNPINAPEARSGHTAVWTGSEMIVWGGGILGLNTGGRYDPSTNSWVSTGIGDTPSRRTYHTALWTGSEMIIWGGFSPDDSEDVNTGGKYDPSTDNWTTTNSSNAPAGRELHTAVWTGNEMIVWGGHDQSHIEFNSGGKYNPAADSWIATTTNNAPQGRAWHTAVWTGNEMIVWGGSFSFLNTGGRYNPVSNSWNATSTTNAPSGRQAPTAVWTGTEMIVWGGYDGSSYVNSGARYNPVSDSWAPTSTTNAPIGRTAHTAVWTGGEMIVWGGDDENFSVVNTGGRYNPDTDTWLATSITNAPDPRQFHSAVWSGSEMIAWGGRDAGSIGFNTGGSYDPTVDAWTATNTNGAPEGRDSHTAVWTGSEMVVWGGSVSTNITSTGGRYCAQGVPTPTPTPCTGRCGPTPRPRPTPHPRPTPP
jgi:N-acetylneuraminic acid mutarotase